MLAQARASRFFLLGSLAMRSLPGRDGRGGGKRGGHAGRPHAADTLARTLRPARALPSRSWVGSSRGGGDKETKLGLEEEPRP